MIPKINKRLLVSPIEYQNNLGSNADGKNTLSDRISIKVKLDFKTKEKQTNTDYQSKGDSTNFYINGDLNIFLDSIVFIIDNGKEESYKVLKISKPRDPFNGKVHHTKVSVE